MTETKSSPLHITEYTAINYHLSQNEQSSPHSPYSLEQNLLHLITEGEEVSLEKFQDSVLSYNLGTMSHSSAKQEEYAMVIGVTLMARAAIAGGVNPYDAYDLNDLFLQRISELSRPEDFPDLMRHAAKTFVSAVKKAKTASSQSLPIEKCKQYICRHIHSPLSLPILAQEVGVTPSYLSGLFSEKENMTIKEYILRKRIHVAKNMLRFSDRPISLISEHLCFCSQSHFSTVFKKYQGCSPQAYRKSVQMHHLFSPDTESVHSPR